MKNRILLAAACCLMLFACSGNDGARVRISSGLIEGEYENGVYSFKGVPYATAERFQPSVPVEKWKGVRECKEYAPWARQDENRGVSEEGTGDFAINVWTKGLKDGAKRPIMFWIHGGGFSSGASSAGPVEGTALALKDVVLVSVNHRLDILGFLDLSSFGGKWEKSVNVGMLDIVTALKWTKENAAAFGGDPDNITIFGESGGGGKVGALLCMPEAEGLFSKAIIQSGAKINITDQNISRPLAEGVVRELGLDASTLDDIQTIPYETLIAAGKKCLAESLGARVPGSIKMWGYCPTCDGSTLLMQPYNPDFSELAADIPIMIGSTFNELDRVHYSEPDIDWARAEKMLEPKWGSRAGEFIEAFREAYPQGSAVDVVSIDSNIRALSLDTADAETAKDRAPMYVFLLNWKSAYEPGLRGSYHSLDIPFVFNNPGDEPGGIDTRDTDALSLAEKMSDAWVNFAKTGVPSADGLPEWEPYCKETGATMVFDRECGLKFNFDRRLQDMLLSALQ